MAAKAAKENAHRPALFNESDVVEPESSVVRASLYRVFAEDAKRGRACHRCGEQPERIDGSLR